MDAISEWNVENDRPILDKWCVTGYDKYNLYNIDYIIQDIIKFSIYKMRLHRSIIQGLSVDITSQSQGLYLYKGASKRGWTSWMVGAVDPR